MVLKRDISSKKADTEGVNPDVVGSLGERTKYFLTKAEATEDTDQASATAKTKSREGIDLLRENFEPHPENTKSHSQNLSEKLKPEVRDENEEVSNTRKDVATRGEPRARLKRVFSRPRLKTVSREEQELPSAKKYGFTPSVPLSGDSVQSRRISLDDIKVVQSNEGVELHSESKAEGVCDSASRVVEAQKEEELSEGAEVDYNAYGEHADDVSPTGDHRRTRISKRLLKPRATLPNITRTKFFNKEDFKSDQKETREAELTNPSSNRDKRLNRQDGKGEGVDRDEKGEHVDDVDPSADHGRTRMPKRLLKSRAKFPSITRTKHFNKDAIISHQEETGAEQKQSFYEVGLASFTDTNQGQETCEGFEVTNTSDIKEQQSSDGAGVHRERVDDVASAADHGRVRTSKPLLKRRANFPSKRNKKINREVIASDETGASLSNDKATPLVPSNRGNIRMLARSRGSKDNPFMDTIQVQETCEGVELHDEEKGESDCDDNSIPVSRATRSRFSRTRLLSTSSKVPRQRIKTKTSTKREKNTALNVHHNPIDISEGSGGEQKNELRGEKEGNATSTTAYTNGVSLLDQPKESIPFSVIANQEQSSECVEIHWNDKEGDNLYDAASEGQPIPIHTATSQNSQTSPMMLKKRIKSRFVFQGKERGHNLNEEECPTTGQQEIEDRKKRSHFINKSKASSSPFEPSNGLNNASLVSTEENESSEGIEVQSKQKGVNLYDASSMDVVQGKTSRRAFHQLLSPSARTLSIKPKGLFQSTARDLDVKLEGSKPAEDGNDGRNPFRSETITRQPHPGDEFVADTTSKSPRLKKYSLPRFSRETNTNSNKKNLADSEHVSDDKALHAIAPPLSKTAHSIEKEYDVEISDNIDAEGADKVHPGKSLRDWKKDQNWPHAAEKGLINGKSAVFAEYMVKRDLIEKGMCPTCGAHIYKVRRAIRGRNYEPLTIEGKVDRGRCLLCFPVEQKVTSPPPEELPFPFSSQSGTKADVDGGRGGVAKGSTTSSSIMSTGKTSAALNAASHSPSKKDHTEEKWCSLSNFLDGFAESKSGTERKVSEKVDDTIKVPPRASEKVDNTIGAPPQVKGEKKELRRRSFPKMAPRKKKSCLEQDSTEPFGQGIVMSQNTSNGQESARAFAEIIDMAPNTRVLHSPKETKGRPPSDVLAVIQGVHKKFQ